MPTSRPDSSVRVRPKAYTTTATRACSCCQKEFNVKGHASHEKRCKARAAAAARDRAFEESLLEEARLAKRPRTDQVPDVPGEESDEDPGFQDDDQHSVPNSPAEDHDWNRGHHSDSPSYNDAEVNTSLSDGIPRAVPVERNILDDEIESIHDESELEDDDIKIEYHPASKKPAVTAHFGNFSRARVALNVPPVEEPFRPFRCRTDFEFGRIALDAALKPVQINALIKIIYDVARGEHFTLSGHADLEKIWKKASDILTPFEEEEVKVPLLREERTYKVWFRPLWDWTLDLLSESTLLPHFTWNAERLYKYDGVNFVRFYDEPWTGDRFWNIQSTLPEGAFPFCYILYADKNKLSSFGTAKGYPVIVRCANLPTEIRNGDGIGGGRVVGWLPVMREEAAHKGKLSWKNHKRAVWHEALRKILESIEVLSKQGYSFVGADGVKRIVYPCILILSADYEEQTYMTLNRGLGGFAPCPVCLVPAEEQANLSFDAPLRTAKDSMDSFLKVQNKTFDEAELELKPKGLRRVYSAFWRVDNSDPHKAVSWDRLHSYSIGIFGDHMWSNFQQVLKQLGRDARTKVDNQFALMPRFRNLNHFQEVVHIHFSDGSKFEDIAKQLLFAAHNVLTAEKSKHGYILLQCLRSFLILDTLLSFEVHTEDSIKAGETELQNFQTLIAAYADAVPETSDYKFTVNWNFIKMHYQKHAFQDIREKGATRNFSTKPNEKLHKPLRDAYHQRTNFKDIEKQILKFDHYLLVSMFIQSKLNELDEYNATKTREAEEEDISLGSETETGSRQFYLGSPEKAIDVSALEQLHSHDSAYIDFRKKLGSHLTELLQAHSIPLPGNRRIQVGPYDTVMEYKLLKIKYENLVTWKESTDYLRCNPNFFRHPRYDSVIVQTVQGLIFARLVCLINCVIEGKSYPTALIQPCDAPVGRLYRKDIDLRMTRVRAKPRRNSEFVSVRTIIRGAVLVPDFDKEDEYLVMDVLDADMFLRVRKMHNVNVW